MDCSVIVSAGNNKKTNNNKNISLITCSKYRLSLSLSLSLSTAYVHVLLAGFGIQCGIDITMGNKVTVKQSRYRPGVAQRVPGS